MRWITFFVCLSINLVACEVTRRQTLRRQRRKGPRIRYTLPKLRYNDDEIDQRLIEAEQRRFRKLHQIPKFVREPTLTFTKVVTGLDWCYRNGSLTQARRILENLKGHKLETQIVDFDDPISRRTIEIRAQFRRYASRGSLNVTIHRKPGFAGPIAVAFQPGILARPYVLPKDDEIFGTWPTPGDEKFSGNAKEQDLVPLAARIAWLETGIEKMTVRFPIACGRFSKAAPIHGQPFFILRNDKETQLFKLVREICSIHEISLDHPAAQFAIWLVRDNISYAQFFRRPGAVTFETNELVTDEAANIAVEMLLDAGLDPRKLRYFAEN